MRTFPFGDISPTPFWPAGKNPQRIFVGLLRNGYEILE